MSDYTAGKQLRNFNTFLKKGLRGADPATLYFANQSRNKLPGKNTHLINHRNFSKITFANMSFKEAKFRNTDFSYCVFTNCYFRGAKFSDCNFTGAKFYDCNFREADIIESNITYTHWMNTVIKKDALMLSLPTRENEAQDVLISLRKNATSIGEYKDARKLVYSSEHQSRRHNWNKVTGANEYYRDKYGFHRSTR